MDHGGKTYFREDPLDDNWEAWKKLLEKETRVWCGVGQVHQGQVWRVQWEKMEVYHRVQPDWKESGQKEEIKVTLSHHGPYWYGQNTITWLYSIKTGDIGIGHKQERCPESPQ